MPASFDIIPESKLLRFEMSGRLSLEEILGIIRDALENSKFKKGYNILTNHIRLEAFLESSDAQVLSSYLRSFSEKLAGARWAIVTVAPASYGMMRMLSVYLEKIPIHVSIFPTEEDAFAWLGE